MRRNPDSQSVVWNFHSIKTMTKQSKATGLRKYFIWGHLWLINILYELVHWMQLSVEKEMGSFLHSFLVGSLEGLGKWWVYPNLTNNSGEMKPPQFRLVSHELSSWALFAVDGGWRFDWGGMHSVRGDVAPTHSWAARIVFPIRSMLYLPACAKISGALGYKIVPCPHFSIWIVTYVLSVK